MRHQFRLLGLVIGIGLLTCSLGVWPMAARGAPAQTNACGCYQSSAGECICTRKGKCDCPGECEPKGCAEKRQKELDREVKEETKKAEAAEKKRQEEAAEKQRKAEEQATEEDEAETATDAADQQDGKESAKNAKAKNRGKGKKGKSDEGPRPRAGEKDLRRPAIEAPAAV
jgi:hypothetical protein